MPAANQLVGASRQGQDFDRPGFGVNEPVLPDTVLQKEGAGDMMSSPSHSSVGRLFSGNSAASSSKVHRRFFQVAGAGLGLAAITETINPGWGPPSRAHWLGVYQLELAIQRPAEWSCVLMGPPTAAWSFD